MFIQQCLKKLQMFSLLNKNQSKSLILSLFIACSLETTSTVPETTTSSIEPISNTTTTGLTTTTIANTLENRERRGIIKTFRDTDIPKEIITNSKGMADRNYSNKTIVPESEEVTYEIDYLHLNPDYLGDCAEIINTETLKFINERIDWEEEIAATVYGKEEAEADGYTNYINWVNLTYNLVGIDTDAGVFSIFYHWNTYSSGAAHPITGSFSLNYDLRDCEKIEILEIFNLENNQYIDILNREVLLQLCAPQRNIDECDFNYSYNNLLDMRTMWDNLPRSILFNDPTSFAVGQYGLFIQFWEYDFGYAGGQPLILIPWFDLMPILSKNSEYADGFLRGFCIYDKYNFTSFEPKWSWVCEDVNE